MEFKRISPYDINISHTSNGGAIVRVGCATFSFSNPKDIMDAMDQFYKDSEKMIQEYNKLNMVQEIEDTGPDRPAMEGRVPRSTLARGSRGIVGPQNEVRYHGIGEEGANTDGRV